MLAKSDICSLQSLDHRNDPHKLLYLLTNLRVMI